MRKHAAVALLLVLAVAVSASSALANRSSTHTKQAAAVRDGRLVGPQPVPAWYWRWLQWRLGEGYARGHGLETGLRPSQAPRRVPRWAWRRLHRFLLARKVAGRRDAAAHVGESYNEAISYTRTRPAFAPRRTMLVSNALELRAAIADLQPGDLVKAAGPFTVSGETIISRRLSAPAELDLAGVTFVSNQNQIPAVWLDNAKNVRLYGGTMHAGVPGAHTLLVYGSQFVTWWGFTATGGGVGIMPVNGPTEHDDFQGSIGNITPNLADDPHVEKGSGLHAVLLDDVSNSNAFADNRFAFYAHDVPVGACVEAGNNTMPTAAGGNVLYLKCVNETFVATTQAGGNGIQFWGYTSNLGLDIKFIEVDNAEGYALWGGGVYPGQTLAGVTVEYGRASNTNLNPRYAGQNPWDAQRGVAYKRLHSTR